MAHTAIKPSSTNLALDDPGAGSLSPVAGSSGKAVAPWQNRIVAHAEVDPAELVANSNVFNLAALLGLSALIAGRVAFHRRTVLLEGGVGLLIAFVGLAVVAGLIAPVVGLVLAFLVFVPYVAYSAEHPAVRARLRLPGRWSDWLARALAEKEAELAIAIRPR